MVYIERESCQVVVNGVDEAKVNGLVARKGKEVLKDMVWWKA